MKDDIELRSLIEHDLNFIYTSWLKSYKKESAFAKRITYKVFNFWHRRIIDLILARPSTSVIVASLKGEPDIVLGFLVSELVNGEPKIIHYCFVKEQWRKMGIGRHLFESSKIQDDFIITHMTYLACDLTKDKPNITYDPYRI